MPEAIVELRDLVVHLGSRRVLDHLSLQVADGEFLSLLGPSGCGKTTALRVIGGFVSPDSGEVFLRGRSAEGLPPYRREVNTVFQHYALFPHLSVFRNVAFGLEMERVPPPALRQRVLEALELTQLQGFEERFPHQLSGGQQQRVALARAVVKRPAVLLLDEPLGALDLKLRREMQLELKRLQRRLRLTFIYVTHDQEEALVMSDRVAVMRDGRFHQVGTPEEVYHRPATPFVADFVGQTNFLSGTLEALVDGRAQVRVGGVVVQGTAPADRPLATGARVTLAVRPEKIRLAPAPVPGLENSLASEIEESAFLGTDTHYAVRGPEGLRLQVRCQNGPEHRALAAGQQTYACFPADSVQVIGEETP